MSEREMDDCKPWSRQVRSFFSPVAGKRPQQTELLWRQMAGRDAERLEEMWRRWRRCAL